MECNWNEPRWKKDNCNKFMHATRWILERRSNVFITTQQSNWKRMHSKETQKIFFGRNEIIHKRNERRKRNNYCRRLQPMHRRK